MEGKAEPPPATLLDILCNSIILHQLSPYLPVTSRLALAAVNTTLQGVLEDAPELYRYTDLSGCKGAHVPDMSVDRGGVNFRAQRMDESLTEDDIYCGPLRGIFSHLKRRKALQNIHTLVLDGLTVPADLVQEIISETNVRLLSIREAQHLNHRKLMGVLKYAVRSSRPEGTPRLKGLYVFGPKPSRNPRSSAKIPRSSVSDTAPLNEGVTMSDGAQIGATWNERSHDNLRVSLYGCEDRWYQPTGRAIKRSPELADWADTLRACEGIIYFDAVLCRGPRHDVTTFPSGALDDPGPNESFLSSAIADVALGPMGCVSCKSTIEGPARYGMSPPEHLPLLDPPPLHSSSVKDAQRPSVLPGSRDFPPLFVRCSGCLTGRWCERCFKWWDEACWPMAMTGTRTNEVRNAAKAFESMSVQEPDHDSSVGTQRVFLGLCIAECLVSTEMNASGSGGMWG